MKKIVLLLSFVILNLGCKDAVVEKPKNLIEQEEMVNIIYDLSLLDAMKSQGLGPQQNYPTSAELLKKKYNVDSLTFAQNSKYYSADVKNYRKMYDQVKQRLDAQSIELNGGAAPVTGQDQGVVK